MCCLFLFKQKTAYEMRISDWSSDVCSSDRRRLERHAPDGVDQPRSRQLNDPPAAEQRLRRVVEIVGFEAEKLTVAVRRSEERRVGNECVSTCRSRRSPYQ